ncbi:MAG: hypothetical protein QOJ16_233 [Acidobacteriota bacterium]|nr:hypothetical protein [Acidobacteriota bacterium]
MLKGVAHGWRLAVLPLTLVLFAQPALAAGQLRVLLEADAGVRSEGNYVPRNAPLNADGTLRSQSVLFGQGGFNLNLSYALPRLELALIYNPFYEGTLNHKDTGTISGVSHRLSFGLTGQLSRRSVLRLSERLVSSPTLELFGPTLPDTVAVPRRGNQLIEETDAELDTDITRSVVFLVGGNAFVRNFDDPALENSRGAEGRTGLRFHIDEQRDAEIRAATAFYRLGAGRSAHVTTGTAGYRTTYARGNSLHLEIGGFTLSSQEVAGVPRQRQSGVQGLIDLSRQGQLYRWNASYSHGVSPGAGIGRPVVLDDAVLGVTTVGRRLNMGLSVNGARSNDFENRNRVTPLPVGSAGNDRRLVDFAAGTFEASWSFGDRGRLHGSYSRIWQRSDLPGFGNLSYNRFFVGLALVIYSTGETPVIPGEQGVQQGAQNGEPHTP